MSCNFHRMTIYYTDLMNRFDRIDAALKAIQVTQEPEGKRRPSVLGGAGELAGPSRVDTAMQPGGPPQPLSADTASKVTHTDHCIPSLIRAGELLCVTECPVRIAAAQVTQTVTCLECQHCGADFECPGCGRKAPTTPAVSQEERESDGKTEAELRDFYDKWGREDGNSPGYNLQKAKLYGRQARFFKLALEATWEDMPECPARERAREALDTKEWPEGIDVSRPDYDKGYEQGRADMAEDGEGILSALVEVSQADSGDGVDEFARLIRLAKDALHG